MYFECVINDGWRGGVEGVGRRRGGEGWTTQKRDETVGIMHVNRKTFFFKIQLLVILIWMEC